MKRPPQRPPQRPPRRQSGALLLSVVLMLGMLAALAFGLNRGTGMGAHSVATAYEQRSAAYLAEAGMAAAKWTNQIKCGAVSVGAFPLNGGSVSASVAKGGPPPAGSPGGLPPGITVTASATTAGGAAATLTRANVTVVNLANGSFETKNLGGIIDTTIGQLILVPPPAPLNQTLALNSTLVGPSSALVFFPMNDIPKYSQAIAATFTLTRSASGTGDPINLYRVTTPWDNNATWVRAMPNTGWSGGDVVATPAASASVSGQSISFNLTGLVDSWLSGQAPNDGMLLRPSLSGQTASFYSHEAKVDVSQQPTLNVTFAKPCP